MTEETPLYDLSSFREMDAEDPGALAKIVSIFIDSTPEVLNELNRSYLDQNWTLMASLAHKLKATIDILSIKNLQGVIRRIEAIGKSGEGIEELPVLMETLNQTLDLVFIKIKDEMS
ncbi:MAG: Hpt domain-containing protein [Bacteroidetes bacterium]|nr:Hpt domain-containing protein [Bacteroidota bacterium]